MKFLDKGIISTSAQNIKFTTNKKIQFSLGEEPPESSGDIQLPPKTPAASPTPSPKEVSTHQDQDQDQGSGSGSGVRIKDQDQ